MNRVPPALGIHLRLQTGGFDGSHDSMIHGFASFREDFRIRVLDPLTQVLFEEAGGFARHERDSTLAGLGLSRLEADLARFVCPAKLDVGDMLVANALDLRSRDCDIDHLVSLRIPLSAVIPLGVQLRASSAVSLLNHQRRERH